MAVKYETSEFERICGAKYMAPLYDPATKKPRMPRPASISSSFPISPVPTRLSGCGPVKPRSSAGPWASASATPMNGKGLVPAPSCRLITASIWRKASAPMRRSKGCDRPITENTAPTKSGPTATTMRKEYAPLRAPRPPAAPEGAGPDADRIPFLPGVFPDCHSTLRGLRSPWKRGRTYEPSSQRKPDGEPGQYWNWVIRR